VRSTVCISPDAYIAARVETRLLARGVDPERAAAIGRKVAERARTKRYTAYRRYLVGAEDPSQLVIFDVPGV
jgi:hypothetical protein